MLTFRFGGSVDPFSLKLGMRIPPECGLRVRGASRLPFIEAPGRVVGGLYDPPSLKPLLKFSWPSGKFNLGVQKDLPQFKIGIARIVYEIQVELKA